MKYVIELYYQQEVIERREFDSVPWCIPMVGDTVHVDDPEKQKRGEWWKVERRRVWLFANDKNSQTIRLDCSPEHINDKSWSRQGTYIA